jgi:hypothetical protein
MRTLPAMAPERSSGTVTLKQCPCSSPGHAAAAAALAGADVAARAATTSRMRMDERSDLV